MSTTPLQEISSSLGWLGVRQRQIEAGVGLSFAQLPTRMDSRQVTLRGEGREFWSGAPQLNVNTGKSHQYNLFAGGGIVWHF